AIGEELLELALQMTVLRPEHLVDALVEKLGELACAVRELAVQVVRRLLELGLHELRVRAGLLAVEHAGADLDGVADRLHGVVAVLLALADEPDGALVVDDEAVDRHAIAEHPDLGVPEWSCRFHVDCRAYAGVPTERMSGCVDAGRMARLVRNERAREPLRGAALDHGPDV